MGALLGLGVLLAGCASGTPGSGSRGSGDSLVSVGPSGSAGPGGGPTGEPTVECGLSTYDDGHQVVRYCGDGVARVAVGKDFVDVTGAACQQRGAFVTANFGTNYSSEEGARGHYVGLLLGGLPGGGTEPTEVDLSGIEVTVDGARVAVEDPAASVAVGGAGLEGTVTGEVTGGGPIEIAFNCVLD
jgi:hypothetical protein